MHKKKRKAAGILFCILLISGCAGNGQTENIRQETAAPAGNLSLPPSFDYEVPVNLPGILVNQSGYLPEGKKIVVFRGENLPESFEIIEEETGETVYSGRVENRGYNEIWDEYNSYGIFDDFSKEGNYYIQAPILGRSYSFSIREDIYEEVFKKAVKKYYINRCGITLSEEFAGESAHNACHTKLALLAEDPSVMMDAGGGWHMDESYKKSIVDAGEVMANLLLSYELYPDAFHDEGGIPESGNGIPDILDEIRYETDWMLKMQDPASGGVFSAAEAGESGQDIYVRPITPEATAAFSAAMAKFGYMYRSFDSVYAAQCLQAAEKAWNYLEDVGKGKEAEQRFFAATELYRATGAYVYKKAAEEYLAEECYKNIDNNYMFWGCITYISTKNKVDVDFCGSIMKALMNAAEEVSLKARESVYMTAANKEQDNNDELLHGMMRLTVADHIITNHEYETVIENHLHYFMGRNAKAISYIDGVGSNNYADTDIGLGIMNRFDRNAELIFMMSEVMSWHRG